MPPQDGGVKYTPLTAAMLPFGGAGANKGEAGANLEPEAGVKNPNPPTPATESVQPPKRKAAEQAEVEVSCFEIESESS